MEFLLIGFGFNKSNGGSIKYYYDNLNQILAELNLSTLTQSIVHKATSYVFEESIIHSRSPYELLECKL